MSEPSVPTGISAEDWAATPITVRQLVVMLMGQMAELNERVNQTSRNSSKPPSSDGPAVASRPRRTRSERKKGGQKGHAGHGRKLKPPTEVKRVVELRPMRCTDCGTLLLGEDPTPVRHQVTELPRVEAEVVEYRQHTLTCLDCGKPTTAEWPADMPVGQFGPRLQATIGYLTGRMGMSQRDVAEMMDVVFHTDISLGSITAQEKRVSAAVAAPVQEARSYVQQQAVNNVDETSWREGTKRCWLWVNTTVWVTVFVVLATRGAKSAQQVLGQVLDKVVGSDRWSGYTWLDPQWRQLCWAHLKRDFQAFIDRGGESAQIGQDLLAQVAQMFDLWHRVGQATLTRHDFQTQMQPIQASMKKLLQEGAALSCDKTRRTCQNILKLEVALWTFVRVEGVEPTNNEAERRIRRAVMWRRRSFGTQSEDGSRFVERVLTVVLTLRQQKRDVLDYLTEACAAAIRGDKPPSLLPVASTIKTAT